jgi:N-acetylneuraminate synthase/N,N'-diacetyllegionaminate synthase
MERLGIDAYKIPSADLINIPLLEYVAQKQKPVLLSTGMNTLEEIDEAVQVVLRFNNRVVIFHCISLYPAAHDKIDVCFMNKLQERFQPLPVGYSGHEIDDLPTLVAVSRDAHIVERHLTLDKKMKGSDHAGSLEPQQLEKLIKDIRDIEVILGKPKKVFYDELVPLREKLAKSIVAQTSIPAGTVIAAHMLTIKGPGNGIRPSLLPDIVGRVAAQDIKEDTHVPLAALDWPKKYI